MYSDLIRIIKNIINNYVEDKKLVDFQFGTVIQESPLHIKVTEKNIHKYDKGDLILTKSVQNYDVDIEVKHSTDSIFGVWDTTHNHNMTVSPGKIPIDHEHEYVGRKKITIYNGLKKDEKVILIRLLGGQKFLVLDRLEAHSEVVGEWI